MDSLPNEISTPARRVCCFVLSLALLAIASVPGRALTPNGPHPDLPPQREILLNGLRVATVQKPGDRVAVVCAIRAGSMFDPVGKSGLANITAGVLLRGAGSYTGDRIQGELEDAGATLTIRTDWDATWIEADAPVAGLTTVLDVMSLIISSPKLAPADVEAVKKAALDRVNAEMADPNAVADRAFMKALYGKHTYGRSVWGDATTIASITTGDVKVFYDRFYAANAAVVAVSGPVDAAQVTALSRTRFGRWTKRKIIPATFLPPAPATETRVVVVDRPTVARPVVRVGFWTDGRSSANAPLIANISTQFCGDVGSRVKDTARVDAFYDLRALQSPFWVDLEVPAASLGDSIKAVADELAAPYARSTASVRPFCGDPKGQSTTTRSIELETARSAAATDFFGAQKLVASATSGTATDAQMATAKASLKPSALTVVVVGDAKTISDALKDKYKVEVVPAP